MAERRPICPRPLGFWPGFHYRWEGLISPFGTPEQKKLRRLKKQLKKYPEIKWKDCPEGIELYYHHHKIGEIYRQDEEPFNYNIKLDIPLNYKHPRVVQVAITDVLIILMTRPKGWTRDIHYEAPDKFLREASPPPEETIKCYECGAENPVSAKRCYKCDVETNI